MLEARDVYKLIHQGVFGPGHLVASESDAHASLTSELQATQVKGQRTKAKSQSSDEELVEEIDTRGRLVRVNLRPLLQKEGREKSEERKRNRREEHRTTADLLAEAMVESARRVKGDQIVMRRRLAAAVRWCRRKLPRQAAELERIAVRAGESGYPAFHHSPAYKRAYRPAYRVILKSCLDPSVKSSRQCPPSAYG